MCPEWVELKPESYKPVDDRQPNRSYTSYGLDFFCVDV